MLQHRVPRRQRDSQPWLPRRDFRDGPREAVRMWNRFGRSIQCPGSVAQLRTARASGGFPATRVGTHRGPAWASLCAVGGQRLRVLLRREFPLRAPLPRVPPRPALPPHPQRSRGPPAPMPPHALLPLRRSRPTLRASNRHPATQPLAKKPPPATRPTPRRSPPRRSNSSARCRRRSTWKSSRRHDRKRPSQTIRRRPAAHRSSQT